MFDVYINEDNKIVFYIYIDEDNEIQVPDLQKIVAVDDALEQNTAATLQELHREMFEQESENK